MYYYRKLYKKGQSDALEPYLKENRSFFMGWFNKRWQLQSKLVPNYGVMSKEYNEFKPNMDTIKGVMSKEYNEFKPNMDTIKGVMSKEYKEV